MNKYIIFFEALLFSFFPCIIIAQDNLTKGKDLYKQGLITGGTGDYFERARTYLEAATSEGYAEAPYLLGDMYFRGCGVGVDTEIARMYFLKALELGYDNCYLDLGKAYLRRYYDTNDKEDGKKAFDFFKSAAYSGEPEARWNMALCYYLAGDTLTAYKTIRYEFYRICYESTDPFILEMMSTFCMDEKYETPATYEDYKAYNYEKYTWNGKNGVKKDLRRACGLLWDSGLGNNIYMAAWYMYHSGINNIPTRRTYDNNAKWAFNRNNYNCNLIVHSFYQVINEALEYNIPDQWRATGYYMFADYTDKKNISETELQGWGISLTKGTAMMKAAELGSVEAMKRLGDWYSNGNNVPKNLVKAHEWYEKANQTEEEVIKNLKETEKSVSDEYIVINDVRNFNLKGKVKSVEDPSFDDGMVFDKSGRLITIGLYHITYDDNNPQGAVKDGVVRRDNKGRILWVGVPLMSKEKGYHFSYSEKGLTSWWYDDGKTIISKTIVTEFDEKNRPTMVEIESEDDDEVGVEYGYEKVDKYGNWIKREAIIDDGFRTHSSTQECRITYYE